ncbi:hypothetical protein LC607_35715 [Nostoc sp. CHAB 5824]|nr:hypothetical protein [Nostoc sp. CHAB 5824]
MNSALGTIMVIVLAIIYMSASMILLRNTPVAPSLAFGISVIVAGVGANLTTVLLLNLMDKLADNEIVPDQETLNAISKIEEQMILSVFSSKEAEGETVTVRTNSGYLQVTSKPPGIPLLNTSSALISAQWFSFEQPPPSPLTNELCLSDVDAKVRIVSYRRVSATDAKGKSWIFWGELSLNLDNEKALTIKPEDQTMRISIE